VVEFTDWDGGFTDVSFLNTLTVDFEGASGNSVTESPGDVCAGVVIYYPDTEPPLATDSGIVVNDLNFSSESIWSTFVFQGVNALRIPSNTNFDDTSWRLDITTGSFNASANNLTVEFFARLGSNLDGTPFPVSGWGLVIRNSDESPLVGVNGLFDDSGTGNGFVGEQLLLVGIDDPNVEPAPGESYSYRQNITTSDATTMKHVAIQQINGNQVTVHYGGTKIYDVAKTLTDATYIDFYVFSMRIDDPAISQIRVSNSALYGTGAFTPPSTAFFTPPS
jgi:hypothetical protein